MKKIRKPAYEELEQLLAEYEQILDVIRRGEVDAIVTQGQPILLRPHELQKKLSESQAALMEAQTIAKVGNWHYDLAADQSVWSEEMFHIHGLDPEQGVPTWEEYREFIHPEDLPRLSQTFSTMLGGMPSRRGSTASCAAMAPPPGWRASYAASSLKKVMYYISSARYRT